MSDLPVGTRVAVSAVVLAAGTAFAAVFAAQGWQADRGDLVVAAILGTMIVLAEVFDISFPYLSGPVNVSVAAPIVLAAGLTLDPLLGGLVVVAAMLIESVVARRNIVKTASNVANYGLATLASASVYRLLAETDLTPLGSFRNMAAVLVASVVFVLLNSAFVALAVAPIMGLSPLQMWRNNVSGIYIEILTLPTFGAIVPVLEAQHPLAVLVLVVPLIGPLLAYRGFQRAEQETRTALETLADALERRDEYTHQHSVRVTEYVRRTLGELPYVPLDTAETILAAARIHDLGKVGVADAVFNKPGKLSPEEWRAIERHAEIGAGIVAPMEVYRDCAAIIRHHHERWDGHGYPDGVAGEAIPLGARLIAVADAFDAMTTDRVYRRAMERECALAELRAQSGRQFDPGVVAAFERAMAPPRPLAAPAAPAPPASPNGKGPASPNGKGPGKPTASDPTGGRAPAQPLAS